MSSPLKTCWVILRPSPVISGETIFIGANDGMLHAFNAINGVERFAYIPNLVFENLAGLKETTFLYNSSLIPYPPHGRMSAIATLPYWLAD